MVIQQKTHLRIILKGLWLRLMDGVIVGGGFIFFHYLHLESWSQLHIFAAALSVAVFILLADSLGVYHANRSFRHSTGLGSILSAWGLTLVTLLLLGYMTKTTVLFSRVSVTTWMLVTPLTLKLARTIGDILFGRVFRNVGNVKSICLVGTGAGAQHFFKGIRQAPELGLEIDGVYRFASDREDDIDSEAFEGVVLGNIESFIKDVKSGIYDEVYISLSIRAEPEIVYLVSILGDCSVPVYFVPDVLTASLMDAHVYNLNGIPVISVFDTSLDNLDIFIKRAEDIIISSIALTILCVPMLLIALVIKLTSPGTVIFKQRRYGLAGEPITIWKFRSMTSSDDGDNVPQAKRSDPRVTPVGAFLRRTSLDELPQFINVLKGEMSVVGPRPHPVAHNELYRRDIKGYMLRHLVKPGITGWAQINGWRGETETLEKMEMRIKYDLEYIKNWSLWFDLKIIMLTIPALIFGKNAY